jgi:hypothetical protein
MPDQTLLIGVVVDLVGFVIRKVSAIAHINIPSGDGGPYPAFGPDSAGALSHDRSLEYWAKNEAETR